MLSAYRDFLIQFFLVIDAECKIICPKKHFILFVNQNIVLYEFFSTAEHENNEYKEGRRQCFAINNEISKYAVNRLFKFQQFN